MTAAEVSERQGYASHKFHYYRNGLDGYEASLRQIQDGAANGDPEFTQRWADITLRTASLPGLPAAVAPPPGAFDFTDNSRDRLKNVAVPGRFHLRSVTVKIRTADFKPKSSDAIQDGYTNAYRAMRATFRYVKCLGWGGEGIASLWKYSPGPGQEHSVVMKMSTQLDDDAAPTGRRAELETQYIQEERDIITVGALSTIIRPTCADEAVITSNSDEHRT